MTWASFGVAVRDWVLSDFASDEAGPLRETLDRATEAITSWVSS